MQFLKFALIGLVTLAGALFATPEAARAETVPGSVQADVLSVNPDLLSQYRRRYHRGYYGRPRYYGRRYYAPRAYFAPRRSYRGYYRGW